jgi:hypothetical protein
LAHKPGVLQDLVGGGLIAGELLEVLGQLILLVRDPKRSRDPNASQDEANETVPDQIVPLSPHPATDALRPLS